MKKVAIVLHGLGANGIDTLFANLASCWDLQEYDITYFLGVDSDATQFWEKDVVSNGVKVVHISDLDGKKLFKWPGLLYKNLKQYGPFDAVHVNMDMLNGINLLVAKLLGIKTRVCHAHTSSNNAGGNCIKKLIKKVYLSCMKFMIKILATDRIACSDVCGEYFFKNSPYKIVYNGINLDLYSNNIKTLTDKNPSENLKFITVGRITEPKNPFFIVEIMGHLCDKLPNCELSWIGTGELESAVKNKVRECGLDNKIKFLGVRNDVYNYLKESDYFLLPSKYEGLSLALAEAQAAGLVCFVSDTVSHLSDCGKCKFISLNKNASRWADEICEYINCGSNLDVDNKKLSLFDIHSTANQLERIYSGMS